MPIVVVCPCGKSVTAKDELAGRRVKCPGCGQPLLVPAANGAPGPAMAGATPAMGAMPGMAAPGFGAPAPGGMPAFPGAPGPSGLDPMMGMGMPGMGAPGMGMPPGGMPNLPNLGDLDDALLRPGRCFARVQVRALSAAEARALAEEIAVGDARRLERAHATFAAADAVRSVAEVYQAVR